MRYFDYQLFFNNLVILPKTTQNRQFGLMNDLEIAIIV